MNDVKTLRNFVHFGSYVEIETAPVGSVFAPGRTFVRWAVPAGIFILGPVVLNF